MKVAKYIATDVTDEQIHWGSCGDPRDKLIAGNEYEIDKVEVHSWHTKVFLKDFPGVGFNSVWFEI